MNVKKACNILELNIPLDKSTLKKQYHKMALRFHPDKNKHNDAEDRFKEINCSYTFLSKHLDENYNESSGSNEYNDILDSFINMFCNKTDENDYTGIFFNILSKLELNCDINLVYDLCKGMDTSVLIELYEFIKKYENLLNINKEFSNKLKQLIDNKVDDNVYIVNPSIDDLFENNIYKLVRGEKTIYIPMWHSELVYEFEKNEIIVKCIPELPDHINIDERNNLHIYLKLKFDGLIQTELIHFNMGKREFHINLSELHIVKYQTYVLKNSGISIINENNVYDDCKKSHIIVHIEFI